ncbi:MAG: hypothetical protein M3389_10605 [Actinomycetota bacterium]|nr:hypothetical protein [Actinomycetota bacterium]
MLHHDLNRRASEAFDRFARSVTVLVLLLWIAGQFIPFVGDKLVAEGFLSVVIVALVIEALLRLASLATDNPTRVVRRQDDAYPELLTIIKSERAISGDLLENAGATIRPILAALRESGADIRLLLCHPEWAGNDVQREAMRTNIRACSRELSGYDRAQIRIYRVPQAMRARKVVMRSGGVLNVGWYASRWEQEGRWVHGHDNAMVIARLDTEDGRNLAACFDAVFGELWEADTTVALRDVEELCVVAAEKTDVN